MGLALILALTAIHLPEAIESWRSDLFKEFGVEIPVVRAGVRLEGDTAGMEAAARHLANQAFREQFQLMQAATLTESLPSGNRSVILLNENWRATWAGHEAALLGHELGHVWLRLRRLPAPAYSGSSSSCLAVHTGDIVQHVLIRAELDRRGIDHRSLLISSLDEAAAAMAQGAPAADSCAAVRQAALWIDARLGLKGVPWPGRPAYENAVKRLYPAIEPAVDRILALLEGKDLNDRFVHRQALVEVFAELQALWRPAAGR